MTTMNQEVRFKATITRVIDSSSYPDWLELKFVDAHGKEWTVHEKAPVVTLEKAERGGPYHEDAYIACVIVDNRLAADGREIIVVDTEKPWGVESTCGASRFEMLSNELIGLS